MRFLKDRTFWLMFVFFFMTLFFHGCSDVDAIDVQDIRAAESMFRPPIFSFGFPFGYLLTEEFVTFEFVWWGLTLNMIFFFLIYLKRNEIFRNNFIRKYTLVLVLSHVVLSLYPLLTQGFRLYLYFYNLAPSGEIAISFYILFIITLALAYLQRKKILQNPKALKYAKIINLIYFLIIIFALLPILTFILSNIIIFYMIFAGLTGNILYAHLYFPKVLGYGVITFIVMWLPACILILIINRPKKKQKPPLKKKAS